VDGDYIEGLDVKYILGGGGERNLDPAIVSPLETLERGGRKRRGRDFLHQREEDLKKKYAKNADTSRQKPPEADLSSSLLNQAVVADAAPRESKSSHQSITTTFSTPQKRRPQKNPPKKVTPIPKLVKVANKSDSVSPLTELRDTTANSNYDELEKPSVAPRGLCFDTVEEQDVSKEKMLKSKALSGTRALPKSMPQRPLGQENTLHRGIEGDDKNPAARSKLPSNAKSSVPSSVKTKKIVGVRLMTTTGFVASRCSASKKPNKDSFSRIAQAHGKKDFKVPTVAVTRKPLLDVYREEEKKARAFMDEMIAPRSEAPQLGDGFDASKKGTRFIRTSP
jgi:hypothetical protein